MIPSSLVSVSVPLSFLLSSKGVGVLGRTATGDGINMRLQSAIEFFVELVVEMMVGRSAGMGFSFISRTFHQ